MKKYRFIFILLVLAIIVSTRAYANADAQTPVPTEDTFSIIYTAIALTLTPLANLVKSREISMPVPSPTLAASTQIPAISTHQVWNKPTLGYISSCDNSEYVGDVSIPDGTQIAPGKTFVKKWAFKNNGSCIWTSNYSLIFFSGDQMGGSGTTLGHSVLPGGQTKISVELTAPTTDGTYTGYWILANKQGTAFGAQVNVKIIVSGAP